VQPTLANILGQKLLVSGATSGTCFVSQQRNFPECVVKLWCTDTSDPRHFGTKTVRHYIFGTEMSYFFVSVPVHTEVSRTDWQRVLVLVSLHHLTSHLHHPSRSSDSISRHFVYTKLYPDIHI